MIGDVTGRNVVIVDDFAISGGTLIRMAEVLQERGAKDIYAAITHGVLPGDLTRIAGSSIRKLFVTDTIEIPGRVLLRTSR
ncbi:MAG: phosphoribosyltransferase family protein [Planctomycetaceae bacterium]